MAQLQAFLAEVQLLRQDDQQQQAALGEQLKELNAQVAKQQEELASKVRMWLWCGQQRSNVCFYVAHMSWLEKLAS